MKKAITNGKYLTAINAVDYDGQQYYILYNGTLDDIFQDDLIDLKGLPLGNSSFENIDGGSTLVIVLAGSKIEKTVGLG